MRGFKPRTSQPTNPLCPPILKIYLHHLALWKTARDVFTLADIPQHNKQFSKKFHCAETVSESTIHVSNSTRTRKHRASSLPGKTCQAAESRFLFLAPFDAAGSAARAARAARVATLPHCRSPFTGIGTAPEMIKMGH